MTATKQPADHSHGNGESTPGAKPNQPPDPEGAKRATEQNDLTTGHSEPDDGGDDNAK
jgi:hypothetical protein